jgi:D-3-phosphoglycerate dehydrogenase / 2-oxoglutarate reductase
VEKTTVLITDSVHRVCDELLEEADFLPVHAVGKTRDELKKLTPGADAWIIRSGTRIDADLLESATRLRVIGRAGVGVDNVDLDEATRRGVLVMNAPAGNTISTAEHTTAMILALSRKIAPASASLRSGEWDRKSFTGSEVYGKTIGIIGVGKIGQAVASRMQAFGMRILGFDPVLSVESARALDIELTNLEDLLQLSDIITVHTPLTPETRGILNRDSLRICRRGVAIVNCARGGIVDEASLLEHLKSGHVGGAALDVFTSEPPTDAVRALIAHPNVVSTPHIAASTGEAQEKVARQVTEEVIKALREEPVQTAVNAMAIRMASKPEVRPFIELADRLASIARQLFPEKVTRLVVVCRGEVPRKYADVLEIAALRGYLSSFSGQPVNLINAPVLAADYGLHSSVELHEAGGRSNRVDIRLESGSESMSVAGTVFGDGRLMLVRIDGFHMDVRPEGNILVYRNHDRPGVLAAVGSVLAGTGINIASLALGRTEPGAVALTAISVDESLTEGVISTIASLDGIIDIRTVKLPV